MGVVSKTDICMNRWDVVEDYRDSQVCDTLKRATKSYSGLGRQRLRDGENRGALFLKLLMVGQTEEVEMGGERYSRCREQPEQKPGDWIAWAVCGMGRSHGWLGRWAVVENKGAKIWFTRTMETLNALFGRCLEVLNEKEVPELEIQNKRNNSKSFCIRYYK